MKRFILRGFILVVGCLAAATIGYWIHSVITSAVIGANVGLVAFLVVD